MHDSTQPHRHAAPFPVWAISVGLNALHLATLAVIATLADETGRAVVSHDELADLGGMSRSSAKRSITALIGAGVIARERNTADGWYLTNAYQIVWDGPVGVSR